LLLALAAQNGGMAMLSLYALKTSSAFTPTVLGMLQSTCLGATSIGLVVFMPMLVRFLPLSKIIVLSCLNGAISYLMLSLASKEWQFFAGGASLFLASCYFPIVRCSMTNSFGKKHYGEALAAVGAVEQLCQLIGSPIINGIYQATENDRISIGSLTEHSIACLGASGMYLVAAVFGMFLRHVPCEADGNVESGALMADGGGQEASNGVPPRCA